MTPFPEHELIAHAQALRSLARALVGAQDADDLVQDAALQALTRPPLAAGGWFGWLQAVLRHRARKHWRAESRRKRREALATAPEPGDCPARIAANREAVASLDAALLSLPEPYQGTLLLRYYDDLTPTEIAASTGAALPTVKSRLQRGLALLRERLDARGGKDWRAGLAIAWGIERATPVSAVTAAAGMLLMGTTTKLLLGAAAIAIAAVICWPTDPAPGTAPITEVAQVPGAATHSTLDAPPDRVAVVAGSPVQDENEKPVLGDAGVTFCGRCVDERGAPLASVRVLARTRLRKGGEVVDSGTQVTGADGTFAMQVGLASETFQDLELTLESRCAAAGTFRDARAGQRIELGDVELPLAYSVRGRVVDAAGVPQAGVVMEMSYESDPRRRRVVGAWQGTSSTTSAADGTFSNSSAMPSGAYWYQVKNRRLVEGGNFGFRLGDGPRETVLKIVVEAAPARVRGIVVGEDGLPVPRADIRLDDNFTRSDGEGRFEIDPDPNRGVAQRSLAASAEGYEARKETWDAAAALGELRVVLRRAPTLTVRVVDARDGRPVTRYDMRVLVPNTWDAAARTGVMDHPDGVARKNVAPGHYFVLVTPADAQLAASPSHPVELASGGAAEVTITLASIQQRRLIVRNGQGPVGDVRVELLDPADVHLLCNTEAFALDAPGQVSGPPKVQQLQVGQTDAAGVLQLRGPKGPLAIRLAGGGLALQIVQPVRLDEADDLVVTAQRGAVWRGRLVPDSVARELFALGAPRPNAEPEKVGIELARATGETMHRYFEPPFPFAADGSFRIDGIPAGTWHAIVRARREFAAATITVREGQELEQDVDVHAMAVADVTLRLSIDGVPVNEAYVNALGWHAPGSFGRRFTSQTMGRADERGRFTFQTCAGEICCHITWKPDGRDVVRVASPIVVVSSPGTQEIGLDIRLGGVDLEVQQPDGTAAAQVELRVAARQVPMQLTTDADGRAKTADWAAGDYVLQALPRRLQSSAAQAEFARTNGWEAIQHAWLDVGSITVAPGPAVRQQLRLPEAWAR